MGSGWSVSKPKPLGSSSKRRGDCTRTVMPAAGRCLLCAVDWHSSFPQPGYYFTQSLFLSLLQWTADCSEQLDGSCSPSRGKGSSSHEHNQVGVVFSSSSPNLCFCSCTASSGSALPARAASFSSPMEGEMYPCVRHLKARSPRNRGRWAISWCADGCFTQELIALQ